MMKRALPVVLAAFTLAACAPKGTLDWSEVETVGMDGQLYAACAPPKGTLDRSEVETVRVDGRLYEVRVASTEVEGEYRLLIVRGTIVIDPDPNLESQRNWNVVQPFMERTCKGPFVVLENHLADKVNLYITFRCGG
jgi:hypothetical protein